MDFKFDDSPETKTVKSNGHKPTIRENPVFQLLEEVIPEALLLDGHDNALLGYVERFGTGPIACYDYNKVIKNLMQMFDEGESEQERHEAALEWYNFNIVGAWVGENTPCFLVQPEK